MSSSFQFQVTNFISAMAAYIAPSARAEQQNDRLHDFTPNQTDAAQSSRIQRPEAENRLENHIESAWLPPPASLAANLHLDTFTRRDRASKMDHKSIRDFGKFVAQLESPSASAFEPCDLHRTRLALSERSLTYADFRHAVDHQIDHASSIWQNN